MALVQDTKNINFCAWLRYKGINPADIDIIRKGKASYSYNMTTEEWSRLKQEFNKSPFIEYGHCLNAIKDLAY